MPLFVFLAAASLRAVADAEYAVPRLERLHKAAVKPVRYRWHNNVTVACRDVPAGSDAARCWPVDVGDRYFTAIEAGQTTWFFARADTVHGGLDASLDSTASSC